MELHLFLWFTALVIALTIFISSYSVRRNQNKKLPPEAAGGWPLIGHLPLLSGPEHLHITLANMAEKYGPIFTIRLGVHRALVVSTPETIKECFTTNDAIFSDRPKTAAVQHLSYNFSMFGFSDYSPYWREMRKFALIKLLSNSRVPFIGNLCDIEIKAWMRLLYDSSFKNGGNVMVDMKKFFEDLTMNWMVRIVAGDLEKKDVNLGKKEKWRQPLKDFFKMIVMVTIPDVLPFLKWWTYIGGTNKMFKKTGDGMDNMLQEWLDHKKQRKTRASQQEEGYMGEVMVVADKFAQQFPSYDADTIIKAACQALMLGGTDTTSVTLTWAVSFLLNNRHTLKKAKEELDTHVGRERQVQGSDLEKLVYIKAIIKETLRLRAPAQLSAPRLSTEDCTVAGYHVPAGTRLIVNLWKIHTDPRVWSDPLEFQPERFLYFPNQKEIDVRGQHFELLPFGGGRRMCPGVSFGLHVLERVLATFLHGFDIETPSDEPVDMSGTTGLNYGKATPLELLVTPRLSPELYA